MFKISPLDRHVHCILCCFGSTTLPSGVHENTSKKIPQKIPARVNSQNSYNTVCSLKSLFFRCMLHNNAIRNWKLRFLHLHATMWTTMFDDPGVVLYRPENWAMSILACWQLKFRLGVIVCNADRQAAHLFMNAPLIIMILAVLHKSHSGHARREKIEFYTQMVSLSSHEVTTYFGVQKHVYRLLYRVTMHTQRGICTILVHNYTRFRVKHS